MFTAGDIIKDTYEFWSRPSEQDLPQGDIVTILNRKVNRLLLLAQLTDRNYLAVLSDPFSVAGCNGSTQIQFDDLSAVVRVESRTSGGSEWGEEIITDFGAWNDTLESDVDSVAFHGMAPDSLTMSVNRDTSNLEFRILYETGGVSVSSFNSQVPALQNFFRSTVFYGVAAEAGMQMGNLNPQDQESRNNKVQYALAQEVQSVEEFKRWLLNEPGQAVAYREAFNSNRLSSDVRMLNDDNFGGYYSPY